MRKLIASAVVLVAALTLTVPGAFGGAAQTPGLTARTITIGATLPLTGGAAPYAPIVLGLQTYFKYVNARRGPDGKRGIMGRQVIYKVYDDGYNPANTIQLTRRLVEQDKVFAVVGQLGTEPVQAARPYLNQQKVPQVLVATGASYWGTQYKEFPWTIGFQPDYVAEGRVYGLHMKANQRGKKIAIIYQNDDYGKDWLYGLRSVLGKQYADANIVAQEAVEFTATSVASQLARIRASGAQVFVIVATPRPTILSYATGKALGYNPEQIYVNSVSSNAAFMNTAVASAGAPYVNGSISGDYLKDPIESGPEPRCRAPGVPAHHGEVRAVGQCVERALRVRVRVGRDVRAGDVQGREEPDPGGSHECALEPEHDESVRASRRRPEDLQDGPLDHQPDAAPTIQQSASGRTSPPSWRAVPGDRSLRRMSRRGRRTPGPYEFSAFARYCSQ